MFRCLIAAWICIELGKLPALPRPVALGLEVAGMILAGISMAVSIRSLWRRVRR